MEFNNLKDLFIAHPAQSAMLKVILTQAVRPDLLRQQLTEYVDHVFGPQLLHPVNDNLDLVHVVNVEVSSFTTFGRILLLLFTILCCFAFVA